MKHNLHLRSLPFLPHASCLTPHKMTELHCPICDTVFSTEKEGVNLPFCSKRCKLIDRARWLGEEYGLPYESEETPESYPEESNLNRNNERTLE